MLLCILSLTWNCPGTGILANWLPRYGQEQVNSRQMSDPCLTHDQGLLFPLQWLFFGWYMLGPKMRYCFTVTPHFNSLFSSPTLIFYSLEIPPTLTTPWNVGILPSTFQPITMQESNILKRCLLKTVKRRQFLIFMLDFFFVCLFFGALSYLSGKANSHHD